MARRIAPIIKGAANLPKPDGSPRLRSVIRVLPSIDEKLAGHVRAALAGASSVREVEMFGGLGFMLNGNKSWLRLARAFVETLPAKKAAGRRASRDRC